MPEEFEFTDEVIKSKYEKLGCVASLMARNRHYKERGFDYLKNRVEPAIEIGQVRILFDELQRPVGFVTCAFLAKDTVRRLLDGNHILHLSEWNKGGSYGSSTLARRTII
ncbi:toxin-activating lysine-acyltransferase [Caballeronia sp. EK]|uniref:toxin-activating lysine-acyltransferase n=1 Tax=Caballeronia sp. EK TaxID=2767469 RepID=UPI001656046D|nr:toxin-activating lysine-acyltransferase [Caballeronia sp. EK]MBC8642214.1 toxin-activating lysine-acyltransferase [Caballeronia sp. EK]